jgi:hypothetical protein
MHAFGRTLQLEPPDERLDRLQREIPGERFPLLRRGFDRDRQAFCRQVRDRDRPRERSDRFGASSASLLQHLEPVDVRPGGEQLFQSRPGQDACPA